MYATKKSYDTQWFFSIIRYKTDESFMSGALRETQEELGIDPAQIEVLGEIGSPETNLRGDMTVWPFVASPLTGSTK